MKLKSIPLYLTDSDNVDFRKRLINMVLLIGLFIGFTSVFVNFIADMAIEVHIANLAVLVVYAVMYYQTRFKQRYDQMVLPIVLFTLVILDELWFSAGGLDSPMILYIFLSTSCFVIFLKARHLKIVIPFVLLNLIGVTVLESQTDWVAPYPDEETRFMDVGMSNVIALLLLILLIRWLVIQYEFQRKQSEEKTERIEFLLRELNHRVKNNLQLISSLLGLQANRLEDSEAVKALNLGKDRVVAMGKLHTVLYHEGAQDTVNFESYLEEITSSLLMKYANEDEVDCQIEVEAPSIGSDEALFLGLIVNEAIINSLKHAFEGIKSPEIRIAFIVKDDQVKVLTISDNGNGSIDGAVNEGLGSRIISLLSEQINGELNVNSENGFSYKLVYNFNA